MGIRWFFGSFQKYSEAIVQQVWGLEGHSMVKEIKFRWNKTCSYQKIVKHFETIWWVNFVKYMRLWMEGNFKDWRERFVNVLNSRYPKTIEEMTRSRTYSNWMSLSQEGNVYGFEKTNKIYVSQWVLYSSPHGIVRTQWSDIRLFWGTAIEKISPNSEP